MQLLYCSHCTDQVKSSTMRERMAAARMISTLVSRPAEESGQGADLRDTSLTTWRHLAAPGGTWSPPFTWCPGARPGAPPPPPACWRPGPGCPRTPWTGSTCRGQEVTRRPAAGPGPCSPEDLHLEAVLAQAGDALVIRGAQVDHGCPGLQGVMIDRLIDRVEIEKEEAHLGKYY